METTTEPAEKVDELNAPEEEEAGDGATDESSPKEEEQRNTAAAEDDAAGTEVLAEGGDAAGQGANDGEVAAVEPKVASEADTEKQVKATGAKKKTGSAKKKLEEK